MRRLGAFVQVPVIWKTGLYLDSIVNACWWVGCGLVLLRGERLADIGLNRPESWTRTLIIGVGFAAIVFIATDLSEKAGFRRDLCKFKDVQGNLELALRILYAFICAGFYESSRFEDFMQRLAMLFGGIAALGLALVFYKARCSGQRMLIRIRSASRSAAHLEV